MDLRTRTFPGRRMTRTAAALGCAACLGGCATSFLEPAREFEDFAHVYETTPEGSPARRPQPGPSRAPRPSLVAQFHESLETRIAERAASPRQSDVHDHLMAVGQPDVYALTANPDGGIQGDEIQKAVTEDVGEEFRRFCRRSLIDAVHQQPAYRRLRNVLSLETDDEGKFGYRPSRFGESPRDNERYGAPTFSPGAGRARSIDPTDLHGSLSVGVRPRLGFTWMKVYRFAWEPRDEEITHRLHHSFGPVGVGAEYRIEEGDAADAGVGVSLRLGTMSLLTLSASQGLQDAPPNDDRTVLAELYQRF